MDIADLIKRWLPYFGRRTQFGLLGIWLDEGAPNSIWPWRMCLADVEPDFVMQSGYSLSACADTLER